MRVPSMSVDGPESKQEAPASQVPVPLIHNPYL
jgi:hypothetical protein